MVKEKSPQTLSAAEAYYKGAFGYKPSEKIEKLVAKLHFSFKQTVEQIAETIDMSVEDTQRIIQAYQAKNQ